jgi:preprotein translocase subunit Sec63
VYISYHAAENSKDIDNNKYYEIMELTKEATQDEIKKQYKELAKKYHPDRKGGDADKVMHVIPSSKPLLRPMKHSQIQKREGSMINLGQKDRREMEAVCLHLCRYFKHVFWRWEIGRQSTQRNGKGQTH